jgi:hypothetical protein
VPLGHLVSRVHRGDDAEATEFGDRPAAGSESRLDPRRLATSGSQTRAQPSKSLFAGTSTGATGLEPATSAVTGQRSNQLSYAPRVVTWE